MIIRNTLLTVFSCLSGLCLTSTAHAQSQGERTLHGQLQGTDQKPRPGLTVTSARLGTTTQTQVSGEFTLKVGNPTDSLIIGVRAASDSSRAIKGGLAIGPHDESIRIQIQDDGSLKVVGPSLKRDSTATAATPTAGTTAAAATAVTAGAALDTVPKSKAQAIKGPTVNGFVVGPDNKPLDSVHITTASGTSLNGLEDGSFTAPFNKGSFLLFSRRGYETLKIVLSTQGQLLTVRLARSSIKEIQEVTVTALGISQKSRAVGYSIGEVGGAEVNIAKSTNFMDALQGKIAGVDINANSGSMGGSTKVTIRGDKSITQDNNALYVVDGVFMNNENFNSYTQEIGGGGYDYGSPIQDVNPDDIQEVSVLKGAAATALYGSRGQNGVILVTTKKGSPHKMGIEYDLNVQMDNVYVLPKLQNQYGGGNGNTFDTLYYNQDPGQFKSPSSPAYTDPVNGGYDLIPDYAEDESWGPPLNGQLYRPYYSFDADKSNPYFDQLAHWSPQPNNMREFFPTGFTINNNIALGGGDDKATYRLSYGNMTQKFIIPNSEQVRNNLALNASYKVSPWLTAEGSINYVANDATGRPGTGFSGDNPMFIWTLYGQRQLNTNMLKFYKFSDGTQLSWNRTSVDNPAPAFDDNPYWIRYMEPEDDTRNRIFGQAGFDIKANSWINISGRIFMDQFNILQEEKSAKDYFAGSYTRTTRNFQELDYQVLATAHRNLNKQLELNATVGGNVEQQNDQYNTGVIPISEGLIIPGIYTLANANGPVIYSSDIIRKQINSVFGTATLGYNNFLFLDVTGRNDWTSTLAPGHNSYFYPSAALSFVFSDLLKWSWLSFGKVRTSWAQIGNDITPYNIYTTYTAPGLFGTNPTITVNPAQNNPDLKPERSTEYEEGLEARFLKSRVGFDFTWYDRLTKDLIVPLQVTPASGYNSFIANAGSVRNRGVEIQLSGRPIESKNFSWDIMVNFAHNQNELVALNVPNNPQLNEIVIGTERRLNSVSTTAVKGQPLFVLTGTDYSYAANGQKIVDSASGYYVPSAPGKILGHTNPDFTGGVTNTFRYKHVSLNVLVDFQKGGSFFSYTNLYGMYSGLLAVTAENHIRENGIVTPGVYADGTTNTTNISAENYFDNDFGKRINKANVYSASYAYLREVRLGYDIPSHWAGKIKAENVRLSLYGKNLWLIHSGAPNVDPSSIINSTNNIAGLEGGALPSVRSYGLNVNVAF
jgi:TonB-linked SusC/RagA family outer membrane protein